MMLSHKIRLYPTPAQERQLYNTAGCARFAYNWGLAEWKRQYEAGEKPNHFKLSKQLNAIKREQFPWMMETTKWAPQCGIQI